MQLTELSAALNLKIVEVESLMQQHLGLRDWKITILARHPSADNKFVVQTNDDPGLAASACLGSPMKVV